MKFRERFSLHPFLFAIYPVIFVFATNIQEVKYQQVIPLLFAIVVLTFMLQLLMSCVFMNKKAANIVLTISIIMFYSYGYVYSFLESSLDLYHLRHRYSYAIYCGIFILAIYLLLKTKRKLNNPTKILNAISLTLVALSLISIGYNAVQEKHLSVQAGINELNNLNSTSVVAENRPDIYYIILDAYAGEGILEDYFGYDNREFISFLREKGFYVVNKARSNYSTTILSLASSLNMEHMECVENAKSCVNPSRGSSLIENNQLMKKLKRKGYEVATYYGGWYMSSADNKCAKYANTMNLELVITVLSKSMLSPFYSKLFEDEKRAHTLCILSGLETIQHSYDKPVFVFAHLMLPHHPYIFGPNGEPVSPERIELGWEGLENDPDGYLDQVKYANMKMKEIVTKILSESDVPPVIVIQGDHGLKAHIRDWSDPSDVEVQRRMSILNAYYLPGKMGALYDTITPVNTFRVISNEYFNSNMELLEDVSYWLISPSEFNAYFKNVTDIASQNLRKTLHSTK